MSVKYCLPVPVFHFWPKLMHPAARSLCDSWATCWPHAVAFDSRRNNMTEIRQNLEVPILIFVYVVPKLDSVCSTKLTPRFSSSEGSPLKRDWKISWILNNLAGDCPVLLKAGKSWLASWFKPITTGGRVGEKEPRNLSRLRAKIHQILRQCIGDLS